MEIRSGKREKQKLLKKRTERKNGKIKQSSLIKNKSLNGKKLSKESWKFSLFFSPSSWSMVIKLFIVFFIQMNYRCTVEGVEALLIAPI